MRPQIQVWLPSAAIWPWPLSNSITPFNSSVLKLNCQLAFPWFFFFFNLTKKKPASWIEALGGNTGTNFDGSQSLRHRQTVTYRHLLFHFSSGWLILENARFGSRREGWMLGLVLTSSNLRLEASRCRAQWKDRAQHSHKLKMRTTF